MFTWAIVKAIANLADIVDTDGSIRKLVSLSICWRGTASIAFVIDETLDDLSRAVWLTIRRVTDSEARRIVADRGTDAVPSAERVAVIVINGTKSGTGELVTAVESGYQRNLIDFVHDTAQITFVATALRAPVAIDAGIRPRRQTVKRSGRNAIK